MFITIHIMMIIFLLAALHLHYSTQDRTMKDVVFGVVLWIVIIHNLTIFPVWLTSWDNYHYIYYAAPFSLCYGPFLYFYFQGSVYEKLSRRSLLLHGLPIMAGWMAYFIFIFSPEIRGQTQTWYYPVLYSCIGMSLIAYPTYIFSKQRQTANIPKIIYFSWYGVLLGLFILFMALQMIFHPYRDNQLIFKNNSIIASLVMFLGVFILFTEAFQRFNSGFILEYKPRRSKGFPLRKSPHEPPSLSAVPPTKVTKESQMLDFYFSSEAIQNVKLNLKTAASQLKTTQKTLSGLILALYGTTFVKLLTRKRIEYACRILLSPEFDDSYERLPLRCGFKSAASFYRHFRALRHCSPTEFRHRYFEPANRKYSANIQ